jgi:hypothetical protein
MGRRQVMPQRSNIVARGTLATVLFRGPGGHDCKLMGAFDGVSISPVALHRLVRPYNPPRASLGPRRDAERAASRSA